MLKRVLDADDRKALGIGAILVLSGAFAIIAGAASVGLGAGLAVRVFQLAAG